MSMEVTVVQDSVILILLTSCGVRFEGYDVTGSTDAVKDHELYCIIILCLYRVSGINYKAQLVAWRKIFCSTKRVAASYGHDLIPAEIKLYFYSLYIFGLKSEPRFKA